MLPPPQNTASADSTAARAAFEGLGYGLDSIHEAASPRARAA